MRICLPVILDQFSVGRVWRKQSFDTELTFNNRHGIQGKHLNFMWVGTHRVGYGDLDFLYNI